MSDETSSDAVAFEEELLAISAILGEDCDVDAEARTIKVWVPEKDCDRGIRMDLHIPDGYPSHQGPMVALHAPHLAEDAVKRLTMELEDLFLPGEVVAYNMAELLNERYEALVLESSSNNQQPVHEDDDPSADEQPGPVPSAPEAASDVMNMMATRIVTGQPYTERKSTFQAHVAPVQSVEEVEAVMAVLQRDSKIRRATHNMLAYRIARPEQGTYLQDYDDDGETAAGKRMLHLLQVAGAEGVCVCVSRWFGGVHLGPSRFTIINNVARELLCAQGFVNASKSQRPRKE